MNKFFKTIDAINVYLGKAVSFFLLLLVAVIVYEVFVRYVLNKPTIWAHEVSQMIYGAYVILLGGFLQQRKGHVNVEILTEHFSLRTRAVINCFTWLLFFAFCGVLFWKGCDLAWDSFVYRETDSTVFAPPLYPVKMMIPLGALLMFLQGVIHYIGDLRLAITGKKEEES